VLKEMPALMYNSAKRAISKLVVGPIRYRRKDGYDAERYWSDRFSRHGRSLVAAGNEGQSEGANKQAYQHAMQVFLDLCRDNGIAFESSRVLEVGPGTGFYTSLVAEVGPKDYLGVDITDRFFDEFKVDWPEFRFAKCDITHDRLTEEQDVALMIDVLEHITDRERLHFALNNVVNTLAPNGSFVVGPVQSVTKRHLFYVHWWTRKDVMDAIGNRVSITSAIPFRTGELLVFKRTTDAAS
jgi:2-polyprenyl-3-methyl-5-hydroxy-6-metoxy-1,4-benzoquinol methylase